jgi:hypothetical protein
MPDYCRELSGQSETFVHLDVYAQFLHEMLTFLNGGREGRSQFNWEQLEIMVDTATRYQFDSVPDLVSREAIRILRGQDPECHHMDIFPIFKFAAQHDRPDLAKYAVSFFGSAIEFSANKDGGDVKSGDFDQVPGRYTAAFFIAKARCDISTTVHTDWNLISGYFQPYG